MPTVVEFPEHIVNDAVTAEPPTEGGLTSIVTEFELDPAHAPFVRTAR